MTTRKQQTGIDSAAKATMTIYKQWAEDGLMAVKGIGVNNYRGLLSKQLGVYISYGVVKSAILAAGGQDALDLVKSRASPGMATAKNKEVERRLEDVEDKIIASCRLFSDLGERLDKRIIELEEQVKVLAARGQGGG